MSLFANVHGARLVLRHIDNRKYAKYHTSLNVTLRNRRRLDELDNESYKPQWNCTQSQYGDRVHLINLSSSEFLVVLSYDLSKKLRFNGDALPFGSGTYITPDVPDMSKNRYWHYL